MKRLLHLDDAVVGSKRRSPSYTVETEYNPRNIDSDHEFSERIASPAISRSASNSSLQYSGECGEEAMICYGALMGLALQVRENPLMIARPSNPNPQHTFTTLQHVFVGEYCWMQLGATAPFGCINRRASQALKKLVALPSVQIEGVVHWCDLENTRTQWKQCGKSAILSIDVNAYGPIKSHIAKSVAKILSDAKLFLQVPNIATRPLSYDNPQYLKLPNVSHIQVEATNEVSTGDLPQDYDKDVSRSELEVILDHIPQPKFLQEVSTSGSIRTPLMKHQKEAVDFIMRRETGDSTPPLGLWRVHCPPGGYFCYKHVITGAKSSEMEDVLGGILADDMGLGKTLSMLAVIMGSLGRALDCAVTHTRGSTAYWQDVTPSKTTLVVVPSSLILDSWEEEIEKHIFPGSVSVHRYHGLEKRIDLPDLLRKDIVLTTYATVAADFCRGRSMLNRIAWYRLVLDEAHYIRNPSRRQFRAIQSIPAKIRWCLTGTPIQNSLEDLAALVKFLRVPVLEDIAVFRKQISTPIFSNAVARFANLSRLLEAICLRRTKSLLKLPEPKTETQVLQLSAAETIQYHDYAESCKHAIDLAVSGHSMQKANQHVIQAILGMRLFCNDGERALARRKHAQEIPIDPQEALSFLQTSLDAMCTRCGCEITTMYQGDDNSSGVLTICQHLMCGECLPEFEADLDDNLQDGRSQCSLYGTRAQRSSFILAPSLNNEDGSRTEMSGYPTKLRALLANVQNQGTSEKCIIFSFWKTTLDIIASMFEAHFIPHYRIHGSLSASKRSKVLVEFEQSTTTRTLLITLGTGAVGLNKLKAANIVHIVEPQWNLSVENQAIGRILRLGQEKSVKIVRYIMKDTIEEAVQSRQLRKLQLAHGGFGLSKKEHSSEKVDDIMNLICPSIYHGKAAHRMAIA